MIPEQTVIEDRRIKQESNTSTNSAIINTPMPLKSK